MKKKIIIFSLVTFFLIITNKSFASVSLGTIDSNHHFAWGENVGWVDFKNIKVADQTLSGSVYGENIGWVDLSTITNDKEGNLSGYAWGENVGWVDFSNVSIDRNGYFVGYAYGENIGFILFNKEATNNVVTDWRPPSSNSRSFSSGSYPGPVSIQISKVVEKPLLILPVTNIYQTPTTPSSSNVYIVTNRILKQGISSIDVKQLQIYLNNNGYTVSSLGPGSPGKETTYFGLKTKQALILFQKANKLKADGIVGSITRNIINK